VAEITKIDNNILITNGRGEYKEKNSTFTSFAFIIKCFEDVKSHLRELKDEYPDSSHICYAYRLIAGNIINEFATDAGEPKGSSGIPILNNLKRQKLVNSVIFVVRYFGGSKLGIPGLIHSYGQSAINALANSKIEQWIKKDVFLLSLNYESLGIVENIIKQFNGIVLTKEFSENVNMSLEIERDYSLKFEREFLELKFVKIIKENLK